MISLAITQHGLIRLSLSVVVVATQQILFHHFENDAYCQRFSEFQVGRTFNSSSRIECAYRCAGVELCHLFRLSPIGVGKFSCELASENVSTAPTTNASTGVSCYYIASSNALNNADSSTCEFLKICENDDWFAHCYEDPSSDLHEGKWMKFIDSNDPKTNTLNYLQTAQTGGKSKEAKLVFYDDSQGVFQVLAINDVKYFNHRYTGSLVYSVEKGDDGFVENASRVIYTSTWQTLYTHFLYPNGTSLSTTSTPSTMHVFVPEPSEYSLRIAVDTAFDMDAFIEDIDQGYWPANKNSLNIDPSRQFMAMYKINENLNVDQTGKGVLPLEYEQNVVVFPSTSQICFSPMGSTAIMKSCTEVSLRAARFNPYWRTVNDQALDACQLKVRLVGLMFQGHKFRVAFDTAAGNVEYHNANEVVKSGNEIYFVLPQEYFGPFGKFLETDTVGKRTIVSSRGLCSWCSHPLEGATVLNSGSDTAVFNARHFVDERSWSAALSVFSNGTVAFGSAADVAKASKEGRDANVLIEWLKEDLARQFTVSMTTLKDYGKPNVLISAESKVSWSFGRRESDGKIEISKDCNMEKVLVKSNGEVQILVYNIGVRKPVQRVVDTRTTWFLH